MTRQVPGCSQKVRYHSYAEAEAAQKYMKKSHGARLKIYKCRFCDTIHLGRVRSRRRRLDA